MQEIYSITTLSINNIIERIDSGALGLPELQRPFVWKDAQVQKLLDSMMRGYPVGFLMFWECPEQLDKKTIGVEAHTYDAPKEVIIDGQQRLTSLYAVIKRKKVFNDKYEAKSITISYRPLTNEFAVATPVTKNDPEWIYDVTEIFTTESQYKFISNFIEKIADYRKSNDKEFTEDERACIHDNITSLGNLVKCSFQVYEIDKTAEEEDVAEIFVRINSGGVKLRQNDFVLTLFSLYYEEGRKMIENFCKDSTSPKGTVNTVNGVAKDKATAYNTITRIYPQDLIRVVMAYAFNRARLKYAYKLLRGADFDKKGAVDPSLRDERFNVLKTKLNDVLDAHNWHEFLKAVLGAGYLSGDMILSHNSIFYSYAMYLIAKDRFQASNIDNMHLTSLWFFYAALTSLYSGSFESTVENHLNAIKEVKNFAEYKAFILSRIKERLTNDFFEITLVGSDGLAVSGRGNNAWNAYVASLNILNSKILFSKTSLLVSKLFDIGSTGKRKSLEKHHLFPKAYLKREGWSDNKINQMANYAYIDWKNNAEISNDAPSVYYPKVVAELSRCDCNIAEMEAENALPPEWHKMEYEDFLIARRKLMAQRIKAAFEKLLKNVEGCTTPDSTESDSADEN